MVAELGNILLYIALILSIAVCCLPMITNNYTKYLQIGSCLIFLAVFCALLCLIYCYITSDFSVLNVVNNSHTAKPLIYKISGAWGNHEGSMLLWVISMAFFNFIFVMRRASSKEQAYSTLIAYSSLVQLLMTAFFITFVIFTSNPFERIFPIPHNGRGLNPILQDIGLAMHPPVLYLGYVGFSISYSSAIAILITKSNINCIWARMVRPFVILSWAFLSLGIMLGSWWAYRELGWGGYWFWDPVENSSLMPWLSATALVHSLLVLERTNNMRHWCIILSIMTFTLSVIGTFIVRSGLITSVHSFALDPKRGFFILSFLVIVTSIALIFYALRANNISYNGRHHILSRTVFISFANILLFIATFTVLFGTLYPLVLEMITAHKVSVGPPYFNTLFVPISLILASLCILAFKMHWVKKSKVNNPFSIISIIIIISIFLSLEVTNIMVILGIAISVWLFIETAYNVKKSSFSMVCSHIAFAIAIFAISINTACKKELEQPIAIGQTVAFSGYEFTFNNLFIKKQDNYIARIADFTIKKFGSNPIKLYPQIRRFPIAAQQVNETSIYHTIFYDIYMSVGDIDPKGFIMTKIYYEPMMSWLWFSGFLMFLGGIYSLARQLIKDHI